MGAGHALWQFPAVTDGGFNEVVGTCRARGVLLQFHALFI